MATKKTAGKKSAVTVSRLTGLPIAKKKTRKTNPAKRIGTAKPRRKSQVTGEKPSMRLIQRRTKNTRKGYYPNPVSVTPSGLRYRVSVKIPGKAAWYAIAMFVEQSEAKAYAEKTAKQHASWSVKVEGE